MSSHVWIWLLAVQVLQQAWIHPHSPPLGLSPWPHALFPCCLVFSFEENPGSEELGARFSGAVILWLNTPQTRPKGRTAGPHFGYCTSRETGLLWNSLARHFLSETTGTEELQMYSKVFAPLQVEFLSRCFLKYYLH